MVLLTKIIFFWHGFVIYIYVNMIAEKVQTEYYSENGLFIFINNLYIKLYFVKVHKSSSNLITVCPFKITI
ncbi:hypothetical protein EMA8858_02420 [Emticicia aquatica]|uniref:Uncharacterized protein n=1 Tax=Emticicia aquatica TaxID=1681835 RepID=A0ABN8EXB3_9BACT|nr:hypothetical protein EMA8858_02420 [Emticicia aquatica]